MTAPTPAPPLAPSTAESVRDAVRDAVADQAPLRIVGRGHWLRAGRPVRATRLLSLEALAGIIEYTPGDLTLTARSGTPLDTIERATRAEGQWLSLDPFGSGDGTLGATVATASSGPLAHAFGGPRDNVLGLEVVSGRGEIIRGGGRVVKNVAGFDLVRLLTGSWGTLGVLTEVTVRLRALPEVDETVMLDLPPPGARLAELLERARTAPLAAWALEALNPPMARTLGLGERPLLLARLAGNADLVRAQRATLSAFGTLDRTPDDAWSRLRTCEPARAAVARFSRAPAAIGDETSRLFALTRDYPHWLLHATLGRGMVRVIATHLDADTEIDAAERSLASLRLPSAVGTTIGERLPASAWPRVPSPVRGRLSRGVRDAFDPHRMLNPGILGEAEGQ